MMMTGAEYIASLEDGPATFFEGERVDDLSAHPILGPAVRNVTDGYDRLREQAVDGLSPINNVPTSVDELRKTTDIVHATGMMAHVTYSSVMTLATAAGRLSAPARSTSSEFRHWSSICTSETSESPSASPMPKAIETNSLESKMILMLTCGWSSAALMAWSSAGPS